jgi:hypothetical protein
MLRKSAPLSLMKNTASIFFLPLVFVWLLLIMTNASIVYAQFLPAPTTAFQQPFQPVNPFPINSFQRPSTTFPSQFGWSGTGFLHPSATMFQPSYTLPLLKWPVLPPAPPSSSVIPTGVAPQWFASSILLSQKATQQQLTQNGIQGQQFQQMPQQQHQQQIVTNEQQQSGVSSYLVRSLIDHQKQTINNENTQCINNTCTNQLTQCTNGVCTTTTTNDEGNTQVNMQVCNSSSNSASSSCAVRQTQITQCVGDSVCTITQTECINGICITRTF